MAIFSVGTNSTPSATINGVTFAVAAPRNSGTGGYNTFLSIQDNDGTEQGFNTDGAPINSGPEADRNQISNANTMAVRLSSLPVETRMIGGVATQVYVIRLDLNETNGGNSPNVDLNQLKIYTGPNNLGGTNIVDTVAELNSLALRYDLDAGGDNTIHLFDGNSGSGTDDYEIVIPVSVFGNANITTDFVFLFAQFGTVPGIYNADGGFEEFNLQSAVALTGTKFIDDGRGTGGIAGDGIRQAGEIGFGGVTVFIDADADGVLDTGERSTVTAADGTYTFGGLLAGTYTIDEVIPAGFRQTTGANETIIVPTNFTAGAIFTIDPIGNAPNVPRIAIDKAFVNVTDGPDGGNTNGSTTVIDGAGDIANYTIAVTNTSDVGVALASVVVTDAAADGGVATAVLKAGGFNTGDTNSNNVLDIGETWRYTATQTALQSDLDGNGGGDGDKDNSATVTATQLGTANTVTATDAAAAPIVPSAALAITKVFSGYTGGDNDSLGDVPGDIANYVITVTNTGNVTLTNVTVTDPLTNLTSNVGTLAPGQSAVRNETYTVTQADLDGAGKAGPDHDIDNTATATSDQTGPASASATAPLVFAPSIAIEKTFAGWADLGANGDKAGDVANYTVKVTNTGNVTLTNVTVVDPLTGENSLIVSLAPQASQTFNTTYTLKQADLDNNGGGDGDIDNTATADSDQTGPKDASAFAPILQAPKVDLEKLVSTVGGTNLANYIDADTAAAGPQNVAVQSSVYFAITAANTGNVELTNVVITDQSTAYGGGTKTLFAGGVLTADAFALNATLSGDSDNDGVLDVGESWTILYRQPFEFGQHVNTATISDAQGASDTDAAYYFGIQAGPGVRTPGFWSNLGAQFWDGIADNQTKVGPTFPSGELLYAVDSNNDGFLNVKAGDGLNDDKPLDGPGLLIGDYNKNGLTDVDEDTFFIGLTDAKNLINSSQKTQSDDGVQKLGRDVVATWLNNLAGNPIGNASDVESPKHFINDAIDWLQTFGDKSASNTFILNERFDVYAATNAPGGSHVAVKSSSAFWNAPVSGIDHSASTIHTALDNYNNTGDTFAGGTPYAMSADSAFDAMLIIASQQPIV